jgi:hypothetical protein
VADIELSIQTKPNKAMRQMIKNQFAWRNEKISRMGWTTCPYAATRQMGESTPEIALTLCVPTTSPKGSDAWRTAFIGWHR